MLQVSGWEIGKERGSLARAHAVVSRHGEGSGLFEYFSGRGRAAEGSATCAASYGDVLGSSSTDSFFNANGGASVSELDPMLDTWVTEERELAGVSVLPDPTTTLPQMFEGVRPPSQANPRIHEKPWHRAAAYHFAQGMSILDVAKANGVDRKTVQELLHTPWFQRNVTTLMAEGGKDVLDFLKAEGFNSAITLVEIRDDAKAAASVRRAAASEILDRAYGKAIQRIESNTVLSSSNPVAEEKRLREDNARLSLSLSGNRACAEGIRGE